MKKPTLMLILRILPTRNFNRTIIKFVFVEHSHDIFPGYSENIPYEIPGNIPEYSWKYSEKVPYEIPGNIPN